jgi:uncharacterized metal-binding protein YceD (DUF177 family)
MTESAPESDIETPFSAPLGTAEMAARREVAFRLEPDAGARQRIAAALGLLELRKLRFEGRVTPEGRRDWRLEGQLGATVRQACVVTLRPVTTRIDQPVTRRFVAGLAPPEGAEAEIPEDDTLEPLGETIDPGAVMVEALALALPLYPRAEDAALDESHFGPEGAAPLTDEAMRPFAGLAELKKKLEK